METFQDFGDGYSKLKSFIFSLEICQKSKSLHADRNSSLQVGHG